MPLQGEDVFVGFGDEQAQEAPRGAGEEPQAVGVEGGSEDEEEVLGGAGAAGKGHGVVEVEMGVIEGVEDGVLHEQLQVAHVDEHAGGGIQGAGNGELDAVVVAVAVGTVARAVEARVLVCGEEGGVEAMGGGEGLNTGEGELHGGAQQGSQYNGYGRVEVRRADSAYLHLRRGRGG